MDIWEGIYLNKERVAIKVLRAVHVSPKSFQVGTGNPLVSLTEDLCSDSPEKWGSGKKYGRLIKGVTSFHCMDFARQMAHFRMAFLDLD